LIIGKYRRYITIVVHRFFSNLQIKIKHQTKGKKAWIFVNASKNYQNKKYEDISQTNNMYKWHTAQNKTLKQQRKVHFCFLLIIYCFPG
jgi:hypothetical protein